MSLGPGQGPLTPASLPGGVLGATATDTGDRVLGERQDGPTVMGRAATAVQSSPDCLENLQSEHAPVATEKIHC